MAAYPARRRTKLSSCLGIGQLAVMALLSGRWTTHPGFQRDWVILDELAEIDISVAVSVQAAGLTSSDVRSLPPRERRADRQG